MLLDIDDSKSFPMVSTPSPPPPQPQRRRLVAVVGSSGGGGSTLSNVFALMMALRRELERAGIGIGAVQLVDCEQPLDFASTSAPTILWALDERTGQVERVAEGSLSEINNLAATKFDRSIARQVEDGQIDGLVSISSDVNTINNKTMLAAVRAGIPVTGTGGTSLGRASAMGVRIVGSSGGSVCTTVQSRALSFASSLAGFWGLEYEPTPTSFSLHGILAAAWPAFLAVAVTDKAGADLLQPHVLDHLQRLPWLGSRFVANPLTIPDLTVALPLVLAVVAAAHVAKLGETALMAGVLAGVLACLGGGDGGDDEGRSTILVGLLTGCLAGWLCRHLLVMCARTNLIPATASSILTAGVAGVAAGTVGLVLREPGRLVSVGLHAALDRLETSSADGKVGILSALLGSGVGAAMAWGSQIGLYHSLFLPLIILEMEHGAPSFLGAVDWCSLCLSSGGICLAAWLLPPPPAAFPRDSSAPAAVTLDPRPLARRGAYINLAFGDFVEAAYPFLSIPLVKAAYYLAAMASTTLLLTAGAKSSAYLPFFVSAWLAQPADATPAALVAFGLPFATTLFVSVLYRLF